MISCVAKVLIYISAPKAAYEDALLIQWAQTIAKVLYTSPECRVISCCCGGLCCKQHTRKACRESQTLHVSLARCNSHTHAPGIQISSPKPGTQQWQNMLVLAGRRVQTRKCCDAEQMPGGTADMTNANVQQRISHWLPSRLNRTTGDRHGPATAVGLASLRQNPDTQVSIAWHGQPHKASQ